VRRAEGTAQVPHEMITPIGARSTRISEKLRRCGRRALPPSRLRSSSIPLASLVMSAAFCFNFAPWTALRLGRPLVAGKSVPASRSLGHRS